MSKRPWIKALPTLSMAAAFGLAYAQQATLKPLFSDLVLNLTPSIPAGLYRLYTDNNRSVLAVGDIVYFPVPQGHDDILYGRQYLAPGAYLLKPVAAREGDHICITDETVTINQAAPERVYQADSRGRRLPQIAFCRTLTKDELFILSRYTDQSYDSRYFGPINPHSVIGTATLLVTFRSLFNALVLGVLLGAGACIWRKKRRQLGKW